MLLFVCLLADQLSRISALASLGPSARLLQIASVTDRRQTQFVKLPLSTGAACLDGTPYVFAVTPGNSTRWTIHINGRSCNSIESCERQSKTYQGSSAIEDPGELSGCTCKNFENYKFADDCMCVNLPMCDGGMMLGYRKHPHKTPEGNKIWLRGRNNLKAALDVLFKRYGLAGAKEVISTGHSVGGTATILTLDYVAGRMPSGTTIKGMPTAGLTIDDSSICHPGKDSDSCSFNSPHVQGNDTCCYSKFLEQVYNLHELKSHISSQCLADNKDRPWSCLLGAHAAAYTKTPMFILNSKYDAWQLVNILGLNRRDIYTKQGGAHELVKQVTHYGANFMKQLKWSVKNTQHVAYITSCVCHAACGIDGSFFWNRYDGYWLGTLAATWYHGIYSLEHQILFDDNGPNYKCDADGKVQSVSDSWN